MKKVILFLTLLISGNIFGQYVLDHGYGIQNSPGTQSIYISPSTYNRIGQSFKPNTTGNLGKIEVYSETTTSCDSIRLSVFSGIGYGGTLLHDSVYGIGDFYSLSYKQFTIVPPVPVTAAVDYSFLIDTVHCNANLDELTVHLDEAGAYSDGTALDNIGGAFPSRDLLFNIYMLDCSGLATTPTIVDVSCFGNTNGSISLSTEGGTSPYYHNWLHGPVGGSITNLAAGTYTCAISDAAGCQSTQTYTVNSPLTMYTTITPIASPCANSCQGGANVVTVGGTAPFTYDWQPSGYTTDNLSGVLCPGTHTLTATDANGCVYVNTTSITSPSILNVGAFVSPSMCGLSTGSLSATINGGVTPYSIYWSTGDTVNNVVNVPAGYYFLEVRDANGCYEYKNEVVTDSNGPSVSLSSTTNPLCPNDTTGTIDISISGGSLPYTIYWSNGETTEDLTNVEGGYYDVYVYDAGNCYTFATFNLFSPSDFSYSPSVTLAGCGNNDGSISLSATGGTAPLNYQWDSNTGNQVGTYAGGLFADTYMCTITDVNGCKDSIYISVDNTGGPIIQTDSINKAGCSGGSLSSNGNLYVSVYGNSPYIFNWSNGATTEDLTGVTTGFYDLTVEDYYGCRSTHFEYVTGLIPGNPQICLVTVDTATQHNVIVWEKDVPGIMTYRVMRETSTEGQFNLIATIPADSLSVFEDTVANTASKAWKYEIQVTDSCGGISILSAAHQPIHLSVDSVTNGVDLIWSDYQGFTYNEYFIYRHHFSTGWVKIDSLPNGYNYYFDSNPPQPFDSLSYMIEVLPNNPCTPTRGVINTTRSNIKTVNNARVGIESFDLGTEVSLFPNPASEEFLVAFSRAIEGKIEVINELGQTLIEKQIKQETSLRINSSTLNAGVYTIRVSNKNQFANKRMIIIR